MTKPWRKCTAHGWTSCVYSRAIKQEYPRKCVNCGQPELPDMKDGLPVHGYRPQTEQAVATVNQHKVLEEQILRIMDIHKINKAIDPRWLALARTHLELGFMALNRAVFQPDRIALPDDPPKEEYQE